VPAHGRVSLGSIVGLVVAALAALDLAFAALQGRERRRQVDAPGDREGRVAQRWIRRIRGIA
jgi:hypothetical protein